MGSDPLQALVCFNVSSLVQCLFDSHTITHLLCCYLSHSVVKEEIRMCETRTVVLLMRLFGEFEEKSLDFIISVKPSTV